MSSVYGERVEALVEGLDAMLEAMREDYRGWSGRSNSLRPERVRDENGETVSDRMCREYCASLEYKMGKKYVKVTDGSSVKAFVLPVKMIRSLHSVTF